eukprot:m.102725 g.102725  ORF g.102725 m.102725 type:complete len:55 (-) comp15021_c1_seq5:1090-1254(-)
MSQLHTPQQNAKKKTKYKPERIANKTNPPKKKKNAVASKYKRRNDSLPMQQVIG